MNIIFSTEKPLYYTEKGGTIPKNRKLWFIM